MVNGCGISGLPGLSGAGPSVKSIKVRPVGIYLPDVRTGAMPRNEVIWHALCLDVITAGHEVDGKYVPHTEGALTTGDLFKYLDLSCTGNDMSMDDYRFLFSKDPEYVKEIFNDNYSDSVYHACRAFLLTLAETDSRCASIFITEDDDVAVPAHLFPMDTYFQVLAESCDDADAPPHVMPPSSRCTRDVLNKLVEYVRLCRDNAEKLDDIAEAFESIELSFEDKHEKMSAIVPDGLTIPFLDLLVPVMQAANFAGYTLLYNVCVYYVAVRQARTEPTDLKPEHIFFPGTAQEFVIRFIKLNEMLFLGKQLADLECIDEIELEAAIIWNNAHPDYAVIGYDPTVNKDMASDARLEKSAE